MKKYKPEIEVDSAGTNPGIPIAESAKEFLKREDALEYLKGIPESLNEKDLQQYDQIIAMESRHRDAAINKCSGCAPQIIVWNIEDPYFLSSRYTEKIFEKIKQKIEDLADSL